MSFLSCSDTRHIILSSIRGQTVIRNWCQFVKLTELTIYKRMGNFNFTLINVSLSFYIDFHTSIFRLLFIYIYIFWKPCKIRLLFYSLACGIGVGVKFEFSIEGVRCEEAGLHCRSLVTGDSTSNTIWWQFLLYQNDCYLKLLMD